VSADSYRFEVLLAEYAVSSLFLSTHIIKHYIWKVRVLEAFIAQVIYLLINRSIKSNF